MTNPLTPSVFDIWVAFVERMRDGGAIEVTIGNHGCAVRYPDTSGRPQAIPFEELTDEMAGLSDEEIAELKKKKFQEVAYHSS